MHEMCIWPNVILPRFVFFVIFSILIFVSCCFPEVKGDCTETGENAQNNIKGDCQSGSSKTYCSDNTREQNNLSGNNCSEKDVAIATKLLLVQVVFRHGDRHPLFMYPTDPHLNSTNSTIALFFQRRGLLTKLGMTQAYELGTFLGSRYEDFLRNTWIPEDIHVQSSHITRTIMTAQACLTGLFPPFCGGDDEEDSAGCQGRWSRQIKWQPIPVYPIPEKYDNKIRLCKRICPAYNIELNKVLNCDEMTEFIEKHQPMFDYVQEQTGYSEINISSIGQIHDTLNVEAINEMELPKWTKSVYPEPMTEIDNIGFQVISANRRMMRFNGGPLLTEMFANMDKIINAKKSVRPKKMYLYSGHDTTVSGILATIDLFETHQPAYTSAVMVELHRISGQKKSKKGDKKGYLIKVFYRNETGGIPQEMIISKCGNPCYLDKLEWLVRDLLISDEEWFEECHAGPFSWLKKLLRAIVSFAQRILNKVEKFCGICPTCDDKI